MLKKTLAPFLKEIAAKSTPSKSVASDEESSNELQCLVDRVGEKMAKKLFHLYISDEDMRRWPSFILALDQLLSDFGGTVPQVKPVAAVNEEVDDDEDVYPLSDQEEVYDDDYADVIISDTSDVTVKVTSEKTEFVTLETL